MSKLKNYKILWMVIGVLVVTNLVAIGMYKSSEWDARYQRTIPRVELSKSLTFRGQNSSIGKISGFVAFKNKSDQPKDVRQYIIIEATDLIDPEGNQVYTKDEVLAFDVLSPRYSGEEPLRVVDNNSSQITFKDDEESTFVINKSTKEVTYTDLNGDQAYLITDEDDFREFIKSL